MLHVRIMFVYLMKMVFVLIVMFLCQTLLKEMLRAYL
uniref:Uncharacterized protein n=1 Tax=Arundo donax TaxID=35708 RepID=A0A0A8YK52_ARUDO